MLPFPTPSAVAAFCGSVLVLLIGIVTRTAVTVALAGAMLTGLAFAFAWTLPMSARLRARRLTLSWWQQHGQGHDSRGAVLAGIPIRIHASLQHDGPGTLVVRDLVPAVPTHVRALQDKVDLVIHAGHGADFELLLQAPCAGRVVLQGLALTVPGPLDLFRAPLYFPSPLTIKVLPRALAHGAAVVRTRPSLGVERVGRAQRRTRGGGSELHEIRELMPGDAFKSIAWKASAKTGRLMVREVEAEVQETLYIVLDVSGSMRGGPAGSRKLDHAIELATLTARHALARGDRVGVITVDGRIVGHARARDGISHLPALQEVFLAALDAVDQDLTEPDDEEVMRIVARYARTQDGLLLAAEGGAASEALVRYASTQLALDRNARELDVDVAADTRHGRVLRHFCRARGIALRYRADTRGFAKAAGLAKALTDATGRAREPRSLLLVTDFDGMQSVEPLLRTLRLLRTQGHTITCVLPDARSMLDAPGDALAEDVRLVYGIGEDRRAREARAMLNKLGIPLVLSERMAAKAPPLHPHTQRAQEPAA